MLIGRGLLVFGPEIALRCVFFLMSVFQLRSGVNVRISRFVLAVLMLVVSAGAVSRAAPINLIQNGNFAASSYATNNEFGSSFGGQGVTSWIGNHGYDLWFVAANAGVSANTEYNSGYGTGSEMLYAYNGGTLAPANFVVLDGDPSLASTIAQTVSGLIIGERYNLSFYWAGGQLQSRSGATTEKVQVTFGAQSLTTSVVNNASGGFTGWMLQNFQFTASAASQTLTFLSIGTPSGMPPMVALAAVSLTDAPEPASAALLLGGLVLAGVIRRRRRSVPAG